MKKYMKPLSTEIEMLNEAIVAASNSEESFEIQYEEAGAGVLSLRERIWKNEEE